VYYRKILEITKKKKYSTQKNNKFTYNLIELQGSINIVSLKFKFANKKKKSKNNNDFYEN
jgi:hypothetical protein